MTTAEPSTRATRSVLQTGPGRLGLVVSIVLIAVAPALATDDQVGEWSRFRGPNGSGVSASTGLPTEFGPERNLEWEAVVPFGRSSPVLTADRIFLTAAEENGLLTLAFDRHTGKEVWRRRVDRRRADDMYGETDSSTPTPATDGENVYVFFQEVGLISYDAAGQERWLRGMGPFRNYYGMSASPILAGDTLLIVCDQAHGSFLLAVDKDTGKELWRRERPARVESYTTPVLYPDSVHPETVVISGSKWLDAYDLKSGEGVWALKGLGAGPVSSPVLSGSTLFVNAPDHNEEPLPTFGELAKEHDGDGDQRLSRTEVEGTWLSNHFAWLDNDADGAITAADWKKLNEEIDVEGWGLFAISLPEGGGQPQVLWNDRRSVPYIPSSLVYDGVLFTVKDGIVSSFDPQSGELHKRGRLGKGANRVYASPVAADGKIFIGTLEGEVAVLSAGAEFEVLSTNQIGEAIYATPAIADSHLYVRTRDRLFSFAIPQPPAPQAGMP